jgi:uncharacterized membrane protein
MAEATSKARRRTREREPEEKARSTSEDVTSAVEDKEPEVPIESRDGDRVDHGLFAELRETVREAALEVLRPVAREATKSAAKYAVTKGPGIVKDKVGPKVAEAGGAGTLAKGALSKGGDVAGGITGKLGRGGGKKPSGHGRGRRLPVQEHVDVAVDLKTAYDQWTQFEEFPRFMHRVEKVEQRDDATLMWHENIWGVRRSWEAEILEQEPCERIVWRSTSGTRTVGVVTFHRLSDRLTRVQVNLDFQPQGLFEKAASGMRLSRRALRSDLMRFRAFIEMKDEPTGAWRGRIEEGDVVDEPEDEGREKDEEYDEEEPEPEAEAEAEDEDEDEEPEEEEPRPVRRRRTAAPRARTRQRR